MVTGGEAGGALMEGVGEGSRVEPAGQGTGDKKRPQSCPYDPGWLARVEEETEGPNPVPGT